MFINIFETFPTGKACLTPMQPTHGSIIIPCFQLFGSTCIKRCQDGYYLEGNRTTKCVSDAKNIVSWNNKDAHCKGIVTKFVSINVFERCT